MSCLVVEIFHKWCGTLVVHFQTTSENFGVIVWTFGKGFTRNIVASRYFWRVVGEIVDTSGGNVNPTVRDAGEDDRVRNGEVHH